jgi:hypothetical protein
VEKLGGLLNSTEKCQAAVTTAAACFARFRCREIVKAACAIGLDGKRERDEGGNLYIGVLVISYAENPVISGSGGGKSLNRVRRSHG